MTNDYVLVIGAAGIDTKGHAQGAFSPNISTSGKIKSSSGGVARNITENLARFGEAVILMSVLGQDRSGTRILNRLKDVKVNTDYILVTDQYHTAAYIALYNEQESLIYSMYDMSVMAVLTPQLIYRNRGLIYQARMVVMDGNPSEAVINSVIKQALSKNVPVIADPTSTDLAEKFIPYLSDLYMVTPNAAEAEVLSGEQIETRQDAIRIAQGLVSKGVGIAVITLAEKGVVYATSDTSGHIPGLTTNVIDVTGAADALTAAIIFGVMNDIPIDEAVRMGASAAAFTLQSEESVIHNLSLDYLYAL